MQKSDLPIAAHSLETLKYLVGSGQKQSAANRTIENIFENYTTIMENEFSYIPHPVSTQFRKIVIYCYVIFHSQQSKMDATQLECHLIELQSKGMGTRGVLRRLIQEHTRLGNPKRVRQLQQMFSDGGHTETPGMQAKKLHSQVVANNLKMAWDTYTTLKNEHPLFHLDEYKVIDLATLLVKDGQIEVAVKLIRDESRNR